MVRGGLGGALGLVGVLAAGVVCAQEAAPPPKLVKGKPEALQLSPQGSLLDYEKQTLKQDPVQGSSVQPAEQESSTTTFGVLGSGLGVGIGYAWDDVLLGARAQLTSTKLSPSGGGEVKATTIDFLPRIEYIMSGGSARPFIAGVIGIQHRSTSSITQFNSGDGTASAASFSSEGSSTRFAFGGAFGVHAFLNQAVSLDPEFSVMYTTGSGTTSVSTGSAASPNASADYSVNTLRFLLTLGLSGWIDTGGAPPALPPRR